MGKKGGIASRARGEIRIERERAERERYWERKTCSEKRKEQVKWGREEEQRG